MLFRSEKKKKKKKKKTSLTNINLFILTHLTAFHVCFCFFLFLIGVFHYQVWRNRCQTKVGRAEEQKFSAQFVKTVRWIKHFDPHR